MARSKEYLPKHHKIKLGDEVLTYLLKRYSLTRVQLKRVLSYTYNRMHSRGGCKLYEEAKKSAEC